jgi:hypothetical protein
LEIAEAEGQTQVRFAHLGLAPEFECFRVCSNAWGSLINGISGSSLQLDFRGYAAMPSQARRMVWISSGVGWSG